MTQVTQTPVTGINQGRADFAKNSFDKLVYEKGYDVIHEKALKCPCVSKNSGQQTNCKNCGGSSWIYFNPTQTKMVIHSMNLNTKYKEWSQENIGTASITSLAETETSFMDRITVIDGITIFTETLFLKYNTSTYYWATIYNIKEISYIGLFINSLQALRPLVYGTDFTYVDNKIIFLTASLYINPTVDPEEQDISVTIRYKHSPQLHIIDSPRDTMQTYINIAQEGESVVSLPVHSIGRRSHYVLDRENFDNSRILDNSKVITYEDFNPAKVTC